MNESSVTIPTIGPDQADSLLDLFDDAWGQAERYGWASIERFGVIVSVDLQRRPVRRQRASKERAA